MTYGISRNDSSHFVPVYKKMKIIAADPFTRIDIKGVGYLMAVAINKAKKVNPNIVIGVCGEHGADPQSIEFFDAIKVDYVSVLPNK